MIDNELMNSGERKWKRMDDGIDEDLQTDVILIR
jgi:hypothetical protein